MEEWGKGKSVPRKVKCNGIITKSLATEMSLLIEWGRGDAIALVSACFLT